MTNVKNEIKIIYRKGFTMKQRYKKINAIKLGFIGLGVIFSLSLIQSIQNYFITHPILLNFFECLMINVIFIFLLTLIFYFPCKYDSYFKKVRNTTFLLSFFFSFASYIDTLLPKQIAYLSFLFFAIIIIYVLISTVKYFKMKIQQDNSPSYTFGTSNINIIDMSWQEFEQLVAQLMKLEFPAPEYQVELTQATHDGGIDVFVRNNDLLHSRTIDIQAKKYSHLIKTESVHALLGVMHNKKASEAIFITTSTFGPSSYAFANSEKRIKLIDGNELLNRLNRYGISNYYIKY